MRGSMIVLALAAGLLPPNTARAESGDTSITVDFVVRHQRIRPSPMMKHGRNTIHIVLHSDGTVSDEHRTYGQRAKPESTSQQRLGAGKYRVVDQHTIRRTYHAGDETRIVTISVNGQSCSADVKFELPKGQTEHKAYSTELGVEAVYGESSLERVSCSIR